MFATVRWVMKHIPRTASLVAVVALVSSGCSGAGTETSTTSSSVVSSTTSVPASSSTIFLVVTEADGFTLQKVSVTDDGVASDVTDQVRRALKELFRFTGTALDDYNRKQMVDLGTVVPQGITINNVVITDGIVTVDLDDTIRLVSGSSTEETLFAQQLAHTALLDSSLTALRVLIDGQAISELWGHLDWSMPVTADASLVDGGG
jgi:hypothetical protein